jgi:hypothetical protein
MSHYQEPSKAQCRRESLAEAVKLLTEERGLLPLANRAYVRDVRDFILASDNPYHVHAASPLDDETIRSWETFYDGLLQSKTPADLKVAYLSGPNPENDLQELVSLGVLPENVWAFESNDRIYSAAVESALQSKFPYLKIFKGDIASFLSLSAVRFDLVYLDFCGPLPSRSASNLFTLFSLFYRHSLNSPGVLISNAAFPSKEQDPVGWEHLVRLVSCYLYPKQFIESDEGGGFIEGPMYWPNDHEEFTNLVREQSAFYYGQFLTRINMDVAGIVAPYQGFSSARQVINKFFNVGDTMSLELAINSFYHFQEDDGSGGEVICDPDEYPLLWTIAALCKRRNAGDHNYPDYVDKDPDFEKFAAGFLRQLTPEKNELEFVRLLEKTLVLLSASPSVREFYQEPLANIDGRHWSREMHQFCDLVLCHQLKELLVRQVSVPYHFNVEKCKRWTYTAKEHQMFVDLSVYDEARYVYDWMPTMDMLQNGMDNPDRQLVYRFALDALNKHRRWYNSELFSGTAIIDQSTPQFEAKELRARQMIEDPQQGADGQPATCPESM